MTQSRSDGITLEPALAELTAMVEAIKADIASGEIDEVDARALIAGWLLHAPVARRGRSLRWQTRATYSATDGAVVEPRADKWRWQVYHRDGSLHCEGWADTEMAARAAADAEMGVKA